MKPTKGDPDGMEALQDAEMGLQTEEGVADDVFLRELLDQDELEIQPKEQQPMKLFNPPMYGFNTNTKSVIPIHGDNGKCYLSGTLLIMHSAIQLFETEQEAEDYLRSGDWKEEPMVYPELPCRCCKETFIPKHNDPAKVQCPSCKSYQTKSKGRGSARVVCHVCGGVWHNRQKKCYCGNILIPAVAPALPQIKKVEPKVEPETPETEMEDGVLAGHAVKEPPKSGFATTNPYGIAEQAEQMMKCIACKEDLISDAKGRCRNCKSYQWRKSARILCGCGYIRHVTTPHCPKCNVSISAKEQAVAHQIKKVEPKATEDALRGNAQDRIDGLNKVEPKAVQPKVVEPKAIEAKVVEPKVVEVVQQARQRKWKTSSLLGVDLCLRPTGFAGLAQWIDNNPIPLHEKICILEEVISRYNTLKAMFAKEPNDFLS